MIEWPCVAIAGPTATGKTALAAGLAHRLGSEIFSMDSRQVYRGLDLGTGKDLEEYRRFEPPVPYHLIDIADPYETYTLYRFLRDAESTLEDFRRRKGDALPPILAGGTGLYLEALLRGFDLPHQPANPELRRSLEARTLEDLGRELRELDPKAFARIDTANKRRVIRALETALTQGQAQGHPLPPWRLRPLLFVLRWERPGLRARIAARLRRRLESGLVEEVRGLRERGLSWERLDALGMEYRHVAAHVRGEISLADMEAALLRDIGRFAKRQDTWFRGMERRGLQTISIGPEATADSLAKQVELWMRTGPHASA